MKHFTALCLLALVFISCNKHKTSYYQQYSIAYYALGDSFVAAAAFSKQGDLGTPVRLSSKEAVTFNGRSQDEVADNVYIWRGSGKPDANFVLAKNKTLLKNLISIAQETIYKILCNDTIHWSEGFVVRVKDYTPVPGLANITLYNETRSMSDGFRGDSVLFGPTAIQEFDKGPAFVRMTQTGKTALQDVDGNSGGGVMTYLIFNDHPVYITD